MAIPLGLAATALRNLSDKLYEKRKAAALEVEQASLRLGRVVAAAEHLSGYKEPGRRRRLDKRGVFLAECTLAVAV